MNKADSRVLTLHIGRNEAGIGYCRISDTGIGLSDLTMLFQHGYTTKQDGHGFGLHYCKEAMINMGGDLIAESDGTGKGASFTLSFP